MTVRLIITLATLGGVGLLLVQRLIAQEFTNIYVRVTGYPVPPQEEEQS